MTCTVDDCMMFYGFGMLGGIFLVIVSLALGLGIYFILRNRDEEDES